MHDRNKIIKYVPNGLSIMRLGLSIGLLIIGPFHTFFWIIYFICWLSDGADGYFARKFNITSETGALLDTLGDTLLVVALIRMLLVYTSLPTWSMIWILGIIILKLFTIAICYWKFAAYAALHTYANKTVGVLLFWGIPVYIVWGNALALIIFLVSGSLAAIEEVILIIKSSILQRDHRGILFERIK